MPSMLGCQTAPPVFIFRGSISQAPFYMVTVSMCLLISEDQEPHSALNYSSGNFMFKSEASLFKNKSPCIVKDDSHCSRTGHSFMFLDLSLLTEIQKEAVRTGKPGNGKSRLRRKIGLKEQGVHQGRAGAKCPGRAVWGVQCWASRRVQGRSESCCRGTASARSTESNIHNLSDIFMMEPVEVPSMKPDVANYRKHTV